jgi:protein phosphatase
LYSSRRSRRFVQPADRPSSDLQTQCRQSEGRAGQAQAGPASATAIPGAAENVGCETLWADFVGRDLRIEYAGASDVGRARKNNEDRFVIADLTRGISVRAGNGLAAGDEGLSQATLLAVADGLGGHASGELAGRIAVDTFLKYVAEAMPWPAPRQTDTAPVLEELAQAVERSQTAIFEQTIANPENAGMGTTLTAACILGRHALIAHAGDSRCYLFRDGELRRLTTDHTVAQRLVERGELSVDAAESSRWNHVLWKVLGGSDEPVDPDLSAVEVFPGDVMLLCSDGLSKHVDDDQLAEMLADHRSAAVICRRLVEAANEAGGSDNVTAVVARLGVEYTVDRERGAAAMDGEEIGGEPAGPAERIE